MKKITKKGKDYKKEYLMEARSRPWIPKNKEIYIILFSCIKFQQVRVSQFVMEKKYIQTSALISFLFWLT